MHGACIDVNHVARVNVYPVQQLLGADFTDGTLQFFPRGAGLQS